MTFCDRCDGKVVFTRDGSTCGCGTLRTRRVLAIVATDVVAAYRRPATQPLGRGLTAGEMDWSDAMGDWASELAEGAF